MKAQCFAPHPGRVLGAAFGVTFEAELARLLRHGGEAEWRAARDTWAGHDVPHQAAYAGWRLSEQLVATGRRKDAEAELVAAYAMAETHVPLRREIEGFARRARLPLSTSAETQPPQLDMALSTTPDTGSLPANSMSCGCLAPAPPTPRSAASCT
jgi:hypothetical protein